MGRPFFGLLSLCSIACFLLANNVFAQQQVLKQDQDLPSNVPLTIDLKAPWKKHPFVLDVIEAIAAENPQAYFTTVSALIALVESRADDGVSGSLPDKLVHDLLLEHAINTGLLSPDQVPFIDISLSSNRYSALIEAQYQYFDVWSGNDIDKLVCENFLVYNNEVSCDTDTVFALKTISGSGNADIELLPTDRIIGKNPDSPIAVLYGDLQSESFAIFHTHLVSAALSGKIQYILRYKRGDSVDNEILTGYGVELNLKRTDYLVIDDRFTKDDDDNSPETTDESQYEQLRAATDNSILSKDDIPLLGFKAAHYVLSNNDPFDALLNVSLDFPKYSRSISKFSPDKSVEEDVLFNIDNGILAPGQNALLINGAPAFTGDDSSFDLLKALDRERNHVKRLANVGFESPSVAANLITKNILGDALDDNPLERYDYRTSGLIWLNDIEEDPRFYSWSTDVEDLLKPLDSMGQLHPIRHNINSFVFALDFTNPKSVNDFVQSMSLVARGVPIQIGIIPLIVNDVTQSISKHLHYLSKYAIQTNPLVLQTYISHILSQVDPEKAFESALEVDPATLKAILDDLASEELSSIIEGTKKWMAEFDASQQLIFANGVILDKVQNLLMEASFVFRRDLEEIQDLITSGEYKYKKGKNSIPIRDYLLKNALQRRNTIINPPDSSSIQYIDTNKLVQSIEGAGLSAPTINTSRNSESDTYTTVWILGDFDKENSVKQLLSLFEFLDSQEEKGKNFRIKVIPTTTSGESDKGANVISLLDKFSSMNEADRISTIRQYLTPYDVENVEKIFTLGWQYGNKRQGRDLVDKFTAALAEYPAFTRGLHVVYAGRILDIPQDTYLNFEDLTFLSEVEEKRRINPIIRTSKELLKHDTDR